MYYHDENRYKLTPAQKEILRLAEKGLSNHAIAEKLNLTLSTVSSHFCNLYNKFGLCKDDKNYNIRTKLIYEYQKSNGGNKWNTNVKNVRHI